MTHKGGRIYLGTGAAGKVGIVVATGLAAAVDGGKLLIGPVRMYVV